MTAKTPISVITGAASGIGRAIAIHAAQLGHTVVATDRETEGLNSLLPELQKYDSNSFVQAVDVTNTAELEALADQVFARFGKVNYLFNNAGTVINADLLDQSADQWRRVIEVNLMGVVNGILAFVPKMKTQGCRGHVTNTGSVASFIAGPGLASYSATKMAVRGVSETLQFEMAMAGADIGVSILCPGPVETPILAASGIAAENVGDTPIDDSGVTTPPDLMEAISPRRCAEIVFAGIEAGQFAIFTHPGYKEVAREMIGAHLV